jgi:hypothetical protein
MGTTQQAFSGFSVATFGNDNVGTMRRETPEALAVLGRFS